MLISIMLRLTGSKLFPKWPGINIICSASFYKTTTPSPEQLEIINERCSKQNRIIINKLAVNDFFSSVSKENVTSFLRKQNVPRKTKRMFFSFVADVTVAEQMAKLILKNLSDKCDLFIENNPGLGLMTKFFLESEIKNIKIFRIKTKPNDLLSHILENTERKVVVEPGNIFLPNTPESLFFTKLIDTDIPITIVGVVQHSSFFTNIVRVVTRGFLWKKINFEFIVAVSDYVYDSLTNFMKSPGKFNVYCLFNYFFTVQYIAEFPRSAFMPLSFENENVMHLIKVTRNPMALNHLDDEHFTYYTSFLRILEKSRYALVIKSLERWFPDCGPHLIREGFKYTNQTCDLTAKESIELFKILTKCEGFATFKMLLPVFESSRVYLHEAGQDSTKVQRDAH